MIGIITFHRAKNYGAILQAYALHQVLLELDKENKIVDYRCKTIENRYRLFPAGKSTKSFSKAVVGFPIRYKRQCSFNRFLEKYMEITKSYYSSNEIKKDVNNYTAFIAGSDQIWGASDDMFDSTYFLDFTQNNQKFSYAASFGLKSIPEKFCCDIKNLLSDFKCISVREKDGEAIVNKLTEKSARVDLDPTLLLSNEKWSKLVKPVNIKRPYVLIYNVNPPKNLLDFAIDIAKKKNLAVVYIKDGFIKLNYKVIFKRGISPVEFVSLFKNAECVTTNSFHGTVFSIIFNKDFYVELDTLSGRNLRSEYIMKELDIKNREITEKEYKKDNYSDIDWKNADNKIIEMRNSALDYLKNI